LKKKEKKEGNTVHLVHSKQPPKSKVSLFIIKKSSLFSVHSSSTLIGNSASSLVTPRPTMTDSPIEGHSLRHRKITPIRLQRRLHGPQQTCSFGSQTSSTKPSATATHKPITASTD
jgi:hypothetical protein